MLRTSKTYKDTRYHFKARLTKECLSHINGKETQLSDNKLFYEIKTVFSYEEKKFIQLDHIDLCIIIRTLVILEIGQPEKIEIFKIWQDKAKEQIDDFTSRGISNIFTAIAKLKFPREKIKELLLLLIEAAENIEKKADIKKKFNSQEISNTLWSFAKLEVKREKIKELLLLLIEAAENIEKKADIKKKFNSQATANTLWALAKLEVKSEEIKELLPSLINAAARNIEEFNSQEISNTLWSFAKLEVMNEKIKQLLPLLINAGLKNIKKFNSQQISNTLWALAVLEQDLNDFSTLKENIIKRLESFKLADFTIEAKHQLFQALTYYNLSPLLLKLGIRAELLEQKLAFSSSSKLHQDIQKNLQLLIKFSRDCQISNEFFLPEIASHIDIKLQYKGKTYYVEIDGPTHFNEQGHYTAIDKFHNRLFKKACPGEIMIRLPYFFLTEKTFQNNCNSGGKSQERKIIPVLEKMLEDMEKLTELGVYKATKEGLKKIQNLGLK